MTDEEAYEFWRNSQVDFSAYDAWKAALAFASWQEIEDWEECKQCKGRCKYCGVCSCELDGG